MSKGPSPELPIAVVRYLETLARDRFFGKVTISFQAGKAGEIRTEEVRKIGELDQEGS